ncbi:MAG: c-type cytochrome domain-containing protein [Planctomycetaceae bacterium]
MRQQLPLLWMLIAVPWYALASSVASGQDEATVDLPSRVVDFQRDIVPILESRCLECHGPEDAKNDFRVDDQDSFMGFIEPGDVDGSSLWTDYLRTDDTDLQMPPVDHGGPLTPAELALVNVWISEGADWPEGTSFRSRTVAVDPGDSEEVAKTIQVVPTKPTSLLARIWAFQGYLHPATVHFPIALLLMGGLFVLVGLKYPAFGESVAVVCLLMGTLSSIAASAMGWSFASRQGYGSWDRVDLDSEIFWHRWSAMVVTLMAITASIAAMVWLRRGGVRLGQFWKLSLLVIAVLVGAVGHQGGELTYGKTFYREAFHLLLGTEPKPPETTPTSAGSADVDPPASAPDQSAPTVDQSAPTVEP